MTFYLQFKDKNENVAVNGTNEPNGINSSIMYCMKRCMQGLASTKESSRQGFYICLTEVIRLYNEKRQGASDVIEELLQKMDECLNLSNASKGEEGEYLVAKCFCIGAIIETGLLDGKTKEISIILERLVKLGSQRSYLKVVAYKFIVAYIQSVRIKSS